MKEEDFKRIDEMLTVKIGVILEDSQEKFVLLKEYMDGRFEKIEKTLDNHTEILDEHTEMIGSLMNDTGEVKEELKTKTPLVSH